MAGKIVEFLVEEDSTVSVGQDLLKIEPGEGGGDASDSQPSGAAKSEPKEPEEGNKDQAAPEAAKEKGAPEDTHKKQEERAPGLSDKPAPKPAPAPKKEDKPAPKDKEEQPVAQKSVGSRHETRVGPLPRLAPE